MTNREVLNTLNNRELGILMRSLLFRPSDWVKGTYAQQHSTPSELKKKLGSMNLLMTIKMYGIMYTQ